MSRTKQTFTVISFLITIFGLPSQADYRDNSKAIGASGGEDHTLILTADKRAWACGPNGGYHVDVEYYYGVLGTGNTSWSHFETSLLKVHDGAMTTDSNCLEDITEIDAGWKHSLALDVNGFVRSWGWNTQGQLGIGDSPYETTPVRVLRGEQTPADPNNPDPNLARIVAISAGRSGEHSLAADEPNGFVYAWGRNEEGQCGNGESGTGYKELVPVQVHGVNDVNLLQNIIAVSAGEWHSMALEAYDPYDPNLDGRVYTWGDNDFVLNNGSGVLGVGAADDSNTPVCVHRGEQDYNDPNQIYLKHIVAISAGWDHSMALEEDDPWDSNLNGRVYTWGNNGQGWAGWFGERSEGGRLGDGSTDSNDRPVLVLSGEQDPCDPNSPLEHITAISAGEGHSMALDVYGYVYTWGDNQHGQLGDGSNEQRLTPVRVVGQDTNRNGIHDANEGYLENIVAISAGYWHSLAIDGDGVVWVWGKANDGRLGLADMAYAYPCYTSIPHRIPLVYNEREEEFWFSINDAIDDPNTASGDVLEASRGVYYESVDFKTKSLTLQSQAGDFDVVSSTVIDGSYSWSSAVRLSQNPGSTLAGFTVTNRWEHGIYEYACSGASVIRNNIIRGNAHNGIYCREFSSGSEIRNNWIYDNGGSGIETYNQSVRPDTNAVIANNTIVNNGDYGINSDYAAHVNISNCIIWDNGADPNNDNLHADYGTFNVTYSCLQGSYAGTGGNIDSDPCFVDDVNDDYHLTWDSNCVDKGDSSAVVDANETDIDGNPREMGPVDPNDPNGHLVDMGADEDYPHCDPQYDDWVLFGRPNCWMWPYQCDGDADCATSPPPANYRVFSGDLGLVVNNWKKKAGNPTLNPCADIDHKAEGFNKYRVFSKDLQILSGNWKKTDAQLPGDCAERGCQGEALGGASPGTELPSKDLLQWLAEIWLDPEVRKAIDEDGWRRLVESVKKDWDAGI